MKKVQEVLPDKAYMKYIVRNIKVRLDETDGSLHPILLSKAINKIMRTRMFHKASLSRQFSFCGIIRESVDARKRNDIMMVYSILIETEGLMTQKPKVNRNLSKDLINQCMPEELRTKNDIQEQSILKQSLPEQNLQEQNLQEQSLSEDVIPFIEEELPELIQGNRKLSERPVIIGFGPSGMFAALILSRCGYKPLILERGANVENRRLHVDRYWKDNILDLNSNMQFGEGGAGTFSDGKLTTRINDHRCTQVLREFVSAGAPEEILYKANPHLGSDKLPEIVRNIRNKIIEAGGEIIFNACVDDLLIKYSINKKVTGINVIINEDRNKSQYQNNSRYQEKSLLGFQSGTCSKSQKIPAEVVLLCTGHSARDTCEMLFNKGVTIEQKAFSAGLRIEHLQQNIDKARYGKHAEHPLLGPAEYKMYHRQGDRCVYTFCMCPGGYVTASASEAGTIVTNGMSYFAREGQNANSAIVVSVDPDDFDSNHPLAGIEFQRRLERAAYKWGNGGAPVQKLGDFLSGASGNISGKNYSCQSASVVKPTYTGNFTFTDLNSFIPGFICDGIKKAIPYFNNIIDGFACSDAILTGVETRTSSPCRITRDAGYQSVNVEGLYPCGEGAGYAGGIMSAAVDGIRLAEIIISKYAPI